MRKVSFIDFEDSFSFNVVQELVELGLSVEVISWQDFETLPTTDLLVLGPGPGHPDDYQRIFPLVEEWLSQGRPFFGVCLGHQIFWRMKGEDVLRSKEPLHGQKMTLELPESWQEWLKLPSLVQVQRYNSLAVFDGPGVRNAGITNLLQHDEVVISRSSKIITYQFHPESVGTSFRAAFFRPVLDLLV